MSLKYGEYIPAVDVFGAGVAAQGEPGCDAESALATTFARDFGQIKVGRVVFG